MTRILSFDNILNFRDFGDYATRDGGHVRGRRLFRSAHLSSASEADLAQLAALDIGLVSDLRHAPERARQPNRWPARPRTTIELPTAANKDSDTMAPHEAFTKYTLKEAAQASEYMKNSYRARPHDPVFIESFSRTLAHMSSTGEGVVVHCAAGKDRTGTMVALILAALGVDDDTIMDDYMMTMDAIDIEALLTPAAAAMSKRYERELSPDILRPLFIVTPDYLKESLDAIGDMEAYLTGVMGLTSAHRDALRAHYLRG